MKESTPKIKRLIPKLKKVDDGIYTFVEPETVKFETAMQVYTDRPIRLNLRDGWILTLQGYKFHLKDIIRTEVVASEENEGEWQRTGKEFLPKWFFAMPHDEILKALEGHPKESEEFSIPGKSPETPPPDPPKDPEPDKDAEKDPEEKPKDAGEIPDPTTEDLAW